MSIRLIVRREVVEAITDSTLAFGRYLTIWTNFGLYLPEDTVYLVAITPPVKIHEQKDPEIVSTWLSRHVAIENPKLTKLIRIGGGFSHGHGRFDLETKHHAKLQKEGTTGRLGVSIGTLSVIRKRVDQQVDIKFYLYQEGCEPEIVIPEIVDDIDGIKVPPLPWHLRDRDEYQNELNQLEHHGYNVWVNEKIPYLTLFVTKPEWNREGLKISLPHDFPKGKPKVNGVEEVMWPSSTELLKLVIRHRKDRRWLC